MIVIEIGNAKISVYTFPFIEVAIMKFLAILAFGLCLSPILGCQNTTVSQKETSSETTSEAKNIVRQIVEASCGECQFGMNGNGCDLAVRIDGDSYYVDGALLDDHGDAHGNDGMCNCVRMAMVTGEIKNGRFISTSFELLPFDGAQQKAAKKERLKKSRLGAAFGMTSEGLVIANLLDGSPAGEAGLKIDDRIIRLNGQPVADLDPEAIRAIFADAATVDFSITRDGEAVEISVQLLDK